MTGALICAVLAAAVVAGVFGAGAWYGTQRERRRAEEERARAVRYHAS